MLINLKVKKELGNDQFIIGDRAISYLDLRSNAEKLIVVETNECISVPTGLSISVPEGYQALVTPKYLQNNSTGLHIFGGTITDKMKGEIRVFLTNVGKGRLVIKRKDLLAQLIIMPVVQIKIEEVTKIL